MTISQPFKAGLACNVIACNIFSKQFTVLWWWNKCSTTTYHHHHHRHLYHHHKHTQNKNKPNQIMHPPAALNLCIGMCVSSSAVMSGCVHSICRCDQSGECFHTTRRMGLTVTMVFTYNVCNVALPKSAEKWLSPTSFKRQPWHQF